MRDSCLDTVPLVQKVGQKPEGEHVCFVVCQKCDIAWFPSGEKMYHHQLSGLKGSLVWSYCGKILKLYLDEFIKIDQSDICVECDSNSTAILTEHHKICNAEIV